MKRQCIAAALALLGAPLLAAEPREPYSVEVWAEVVFDSEGKATQVEVPDTAGQPAAFIERLKRQLAAAKVPPPRDAAGAPATLQSGVRVSVLITPQDGGGASARLTGIKIEARTVKAYAAGLPDGVAAGGVYDARVRCTVTTEGRCRDAVVEYTTLVNDAMRRWALASINGYLFAPQRLNGQPIESEVTLTMRLHMDDSMPREFRQHQQAR